MFSKVLLVDDSPDIRRLVAFGLTRNGRVEVLEAETGAEGLELAARERPDVILVRDPHRSHTTPAGVTTQGPSYSVSG